MKVSCMLRSNKGTLRRHSSDICSSKHRPNKLALSFLKIMRLTVFLFLRLKEQFGLSADFERGVTI